MRTIPYEISKSIEKAILFLVNEYQKSGSNPKPVVLHSLRVAFYLMEHGYKEAIIVAAVLHDLIEDTKASSELIRKNFGSEVGELISAVSFKYEIVDKFERSKEMFERTKAAGKDALIIKAADIYDNSFYYHLAADNETKEYLKKKIEYFLEISKSAIGDEQVWKDLNSRALE